jgi:hypothetical protein
MNSRIIFGTPDGGVAVLIPTGELPTEVVARKDVPQGVGYKILDLADIEDTISDRTFRGAWEADFETPDGYVILKVTGPRRKPSASQKKPTAAPDERQLNPPMK